ncbi:MAG: hypothetical protein HYX68_17200 [Planctomycetes bacterium]|nr:hypothetical protein [Planctomycetota bacterium]
MATRRRFLQAAAVAATLPLVADGAQAPPASADQALLALVRLRFKHLNEDQVKAVHAGLRGDLAGAEILRRVRLDPTDEPATVFVADVAE